MEQNVPVTAKRIWSIVKAVLFMMRKGITSKRKLIMLDLNMILKRSKTASVKAINNLISHHHHNNNNNSQLATFSAAEATAASANEYEFSCSNTPNYIFPFNVLKKKTNYYHNFITCTHAPPTLDDDDNNMAVAVKVALEILNNNNNNAVGASPMLPEFGQTPLARQLRITDSPFPLRDVDENDDVVDRAAEDFINRFYKDLKQQNKKMADS